MPNTKKLPKTKHRQEVGSVHHRRPSVRNGDRHDGDGDRSLPHASASLGQLHYVRHLRTGVPATHIQGAESRDLPPVQRGPERLSTGTLVVGKPIKVP